MSSRREEQERRRAERLAAEQRESAAARRRLLVGYIVAGALGLAVVVGLVVVLSSGGGDTAQINGEDIPEAAHIQLGAGSTNGIKPDGREGTTPPPIEQGDLELAAKAAGCELMLDLPDEGNTHIPPDSKTPDYKTSPPTSGNHVVTGRQQADGAYLKAPGAIFFVHSMEHGRVEIHYSSKLPEKDQLAIKGVFDESPEAMLMFPDDDMPYEVAATAWTQLIGCKTYQGAATLDAIRDFRDIYRGQAPEDVPLVTG